MWLLFQLQPDPSSLSSLGPFAAFGALALTALGLLWRRNVALEREKQAMAEQVMALTREVLPVLTEVTSELRRLIDHRERER